MNQQHRKKSSASAAVTVLLLVLIVVLFAAIIIKDRASGNGTVSNSNISQSGGTQNGNTDNNGQTLPDPVWHEQSEQDAMPAVNNVSYTPPAEAVLPYYIKVNRAMCTVTVYGIDSNGEYTIPVKAFVCSVGKSGNETITGEYELHDRFNTTWCYMVDGSYSQYAYRIHNGYMFHVVPSTKNAKNTLEAEEYNKLGEPASLGCVRLNNEAAIWITENCKVGTKVLIYDDEQTPGPLGKPESIKIPIGHQYSGWDPTDPDENNPWNTCQPRIEAADITVSAGTDINILNGVRAYDTCGNDISDKIYWFGKYTTDAEGSYTVTLGVTDALGRSARSTLTINVTPRQSGSQDNNTNSTDGDTPASTQPVYNAVIENTGIQSEIESDYALLLSRADGSIIIDKKSTERVYPASIVKMMTLIVSLENLTDMDERLVITQETYDALLERGSSMSGLPLDVPVKVKDMLRGSFMPSGADASVTLAKRIAGSESAFVDLMNQKAAAIGMADTHYINATGLDEDGQYTTCRDIAKLLDYALKNEKFREIFTTRTYTTEALEGFPNGITLGSTMFNALPASDFANGIHILGGKTGYTNKAGLCLASLAKSDVSGNEYILITMKAPGTYHDTPYPSHTEDAVKVYKVIKEVVVEHE